MRAPTAHFAYHYSEPQWAAIAATLRHLGDANRMTVPGSQEIVPGGHESYHVHGCDVDVPEGFELPEGHMMLRTALQRLVVFALANCPTRISLATHRQLHEQTETLRARFANAGYHSFARDLGKIASTLDWRPRKPRNRFDAERSHVLAALLDFWVHELGEKPRGKDCEGFLAACITPVTRPTSGKAIARWLERYHRGEIIFR